jgi:hypothetical protein
MFRGGHGGDRGDFCGGHGKDLGAFGRGRWSGPGEPLAF